MQNSDRILHSFRAGFVFSTAQLGFAKISLAQLFSFIFAKMNEAGYKSRANILGDVLEDVITKQLNPSSDSLSLAVQGVDPSPFAGAGFELKEVLETTQILSNMSSPNWNSNPKPIKIRHTALGPLIEQQVLKFQNFAALPSRKAIIIITSGAPNYGVYRIKDDGVDGLPKNFPKHPLTRGTGRLYAIRTEPNLARDDIRTSPSIYYTKDLITSLTSPHAILIPDLSPAWNKKYCPLRKFKVISGIYLEGGGLWNHVGQAYEGKDSTDPNKYPSCGLMFQYPNIDTTGWTMDPSNGACVSNLGGCDWGLSHRPSSLCTNYNLAGTVADCGSDFYYRTRIYEGGATHGVMFDWGLGLTDLDLSNQPFNDGQEIPKSDPNYIPPCFKRAANGGKISIQGHHKSYSRALTQRTLRQLPYIYPASFIFAKKWMENSWASEILG